MDIEMLKEHYAAILKDTEDTSWPSIEYKILRRIIDNLQEMRTRNITREHAKFWAIWGREIDEAKGTTGGLELSNVSELP